MFDSPLALVAGHVTTNALGDKFLTLLDAACVESRARLALKYFRALNWHSIFDEFSGYGCID